MGGKIKLTKLDPNKRVFLIKNEPLFHDEDKDMSYKKLLRIQKRGRAVKIINIFEGRKSPQKNKSVIHKSGTYRCQCQDFWEKEVFNHLLSHRTVFVVVPDKHAHCIMN